MELLGKREKKTGKTKGRKKKGEEEYERYADELVSVIQRVAADKRLLKEFFKDLLSPAEYKELGVRWQIVKQLSQGKSHRDVANDLRTAVATVQRGARELADKHGGFRQVLHLLSQKKERETRKANQTE